MGDRDRGRWDKGVGEIGGIRGFGVGGQGGHGVGA